MDNKIISSLTPINRFNFLKNDLLDYFQNSWRLTETLFSSIKNDNTLFIAPDPYRLPLIFYFGHTAAFYINKFIRSGLLRKHINISFERLFAEGVDPEHPRELDNLINWPKFEELVVYREKVYKCVLDIIDNVKINYISSDTPEWAILMAIDHERIHFETSSVLIRQYDSVLLNKPTEWYYAPIINSGQNDKMIFIPEGNVVLGKPDGHPNFGWDNEYGYLSQYVRPFYASKNLVTNRSIINFFEDKGYMRKELWSEDGWKWKCECRVNKPRFLDYSGGQYFYRAMFDSFKMPENWPAEVNFFEAEAYCNWLGEGARLMMELEFKRLVDYNKKEGEPFLNRSFNINLKFGSPCSVEYFEDSKNNTLFNDIYGNVYQWLSTFFYPLPGFRIHYLYPHFSYPFFGKKHAMLRGGSWASTGASASKYYRLWFRKNMYQHAGFRIAKDAT